MKEVSRRDTSKYWVEVNFEYAIFNFTLQKCYSFIKRRRVYRFGTRKPVQPLHFISKCLYQAMKVSSLCIFVLRVSIFTLSMIFLMDFKTVSSVVSFVFHIQFCYLIKGFAYCANTDIYCPTRNIICSSMIFTFRYINVSFSFSMWKL